MPCKTLEITLNDGYIPYIYSIEVIRYNDIKNLSFVDGLVNIETSKNPEKHIHTDENCIFKTTEPFRDGKKILVKHELSLGFDLKNVLSPVFIIHWNDYKEVFGINAKGEYSLIKEKDLFCDLNRTVIMELKNITINSE